MTTIRRTAGDYRPMPWKNGGGTTTELVIEPEGSGVGQGFLYRVSIADVDADGPFSLFPGYDRHIMLLSGAGMALVMESGTIELARPFEAQTFAGETPILGKLKAGPVRDFNVMVDRKKGRAALECTRVDHQLTLAGGHATTWVVHVIEGGLADANAGDTLIANGDLRLEPAPTARLAIVRIDRSS
jgi:environmental stress-induced protein Ves